MIRLTTISAILQYIEDNLGKCTINIDSLVNYSGYSRRYLQMLFKEHIGMPVGKYIRLRKITKAAFFLKLTNLTLAEISERLLYDSQQTFTKEFKKNTGFTPKQYRDFEEWPFNNLLGERKISLQLPVPEIIYKERVEIHGNHFSYNECIPYKGEPSDIRWKKIDAHFTTFDRPFYSSNYLQKSKNKDQITVNTVIWSKQYHESSLISIESGWFACFSFRGKKEEYALFINGIYTNVLALYSLSKRDSYDIEIIEKLSDDEYQFEYYLPVSFNASIMKLLKYKYLRADIVTVALNRHG
ncbi:helix-turn-helix domain-containing protein [Salmonella enterica]|nr:helix-turn-helix domain-containing protein [Salmonella enterica]